MNLFRYLSSSFTFEVVDVGESFLEFRLFVAADLLLGVLEVLIQNFN